uniref:PDZ domain-containing protein n=1 Tax=Physcomitrium patens TaxID=3218 RepID=A0A7I4DIM3_PHYPA
MALSLATYSAHSCLSMKQQNGVIAANRTGQFSPLHGLRKQRVKNGFSGTRLVITPKLRCLKLGFAVAKAVRIVSSRGFEEVRVRGNGVKEVELRNSVEAEDGFASSSGREEGLDVESLWRAVRKRVLGGGRGWGSLVEKLITASSAAAVWMTSAAIVMGLLMSEPLDASALVLAPRKLQGDELATVQLFQENTPSVVYITNLAVRRDVFTLDVMSVPQGSGSGFIWDKKGHVVTNYHVIRGASDLRVTLGDQSVYEADVVGYDEDKDVAVLHIDAPEDKLRPLTVGSSSDLLVGQKVFAIGNPFGLDHTLTTGVISGGPLLDSAGNLIGINTAIYSPSGASSGVGFSIPVDTVSGIVEQIVKFGKVTRPVLGISFAPEQAVEQLGVSGVLVLDAPPNGPAGKAGLRPTTRDSYGRLVLGDVITSVNGKKIANGSDLYKILDRCKVGDMVKLEVLRGDQKVSVDVTLEPRD